jgi:hypothetical protein
MGSKSGGGTSTVVSDLPDYARPYMQDILATGKEEYITPYVGYGGERIAPESTQRRLVSEGIESLVQTGSPYYGEAMDLTRGAIRQSQVPSEFTTEAAQRYMSPFLEQSLGRQKAAAISEYAGQTADRKAQAARAGAFGGSREAVLQGQAEKGMLNRLADIEAKGREAAFEQARAQFEADRGYRSGQIGTQAELASGLAGLGESSTQAYLQRLQQLEGVGKAEEARKQLELDEQYQEFMRQQGYPTEQLEKFSDLVRGIPGRADTTYGPPPDILTQLLGSGVTGLQLYNMGAFGGGS